MPVASWFGYDFPDRTLNVRDSGCHALPETACSTELLINKESCQELMVYACIAQIQGQRMKPVLEQVVDEQARTVGHCKETARVKDDSQVDNHVLRSRWRGGTRGQARTRRNQLGPCCELFPRRGCTQPLKGCSCAVA